MCGSAGACITTPLPITDADVMAADATVSDANPVTSDGPAFDAGSSSDASSDAAQASDAGGGATLIDAGLAPPADANTGV